MAEIGLVASIFGLAAFGTSVATTLYEAADIMINANQQLLALAKHVSQFTAVLKHMGQVLETEKANCSKEILRDIRKIKHSCKRTFREISSTVKSKRFRHFVPVRWLFKRTKAIELEARLDSQQSMLQCMIHTLTVSKLGRIDSRSKQDSEHIKVELQFLKTVVMESYNNLTELRRAEWHTEEETRYQPMSGGGSHPGRHSFDDGSTLPSNPIDITITSSPSPPSSALNSDNEDLDSDDAINTKHKDQNDQDGTGRMGDTSNTDGLVSRSFFQPRLSYDAPDPSIHRESDFLLQIVPYNPVIPAPIRSGLLISGGQGSDSGTKSATQEATNSVRLLLDKWTTSGSAPVSNILDEEAARGKSEAELASKRKTSGPQFDAYRQFSSPGAESYEDDFGPRHYPGRYEYSRRLEDDHMPPPPPWNGSQSQYGYPPFGTSGPRQKDIWRPSPFFSQPPDGQLGGEILNALRSTRGGIHYTKSNQFKQVHYVDQYPIYTCAIVPSHVVSSIESKPLNTELGSGLIRKEALDLLQYSYTETGTGMFSISGDLELREIEELVKLSYQGLDRNLKERSKTVIKERGWGEAIDAMNLGMPGMYSNEPFTGPQYPPPMAEPWNQNTPQYDGNTGYRPYFEDETLLQDRSASSQAPLPPHLRARESPSARRRTRLIPTSPPIDIYDLEQEAMKKRRERSRKEVRFTLPQAQLASSAADTAKEAQPSPAKPKVPTTKTDDKLQKARQKLEQLKKKKEEAEKANNLTTASDIMYYAIPELEMQIKDLVQKQREEQEKHAAPASRNEEDKKSHQTEVETDSEYSDDGV